MWPHFSGCGYSVEWSENYSGKPPYSRPAITHTSSMQPGSANAAPYLDGLEAESIFILREAVAEGRRPVMLYSIGKDSGVLLHLAKKAFYPAPLPFPLLHVDTRWKFRAMYALRDQVAQESGINLIVHINPEAIVRNINPLDRDGGAVEQFEFGLQRIEFHITPSLRSVLRSFPHIPCATWRRRCTTENSTLHTSAQTAIP